MCDNPLVSIVTPCWNSCTTIKRCLESVQKQTYFYWEHVVVDGGSTDGTLDILRSKQWKNLYWVSESDKGIYNAMNKGITLSKGEIIVVLNSDDMFFPDAVQNAVYALRSSLVQATYGIVYRTLDGGIRSTLNRAMIHDSKSWLYMPMPHISVFAKRELYDQWGTFDENYQLAADFDLVSRWHLKGVKFAELNGVVGFADLGGATSGCGAQKVLQEFKSIALAHGVSALIAWKWYIWMRYKWFLIRLLPQKLLYWFLRKSSQ